MATQIVASTPQIHVIPFPTTREPIPQSQLSLLLSLRGAVATTTAKLQAVEAEIRTALESGAVVEPGQHTATLAESKRRNISWKSIAERLAVRLYGTARGTTYCARVLASTKPESKVTLEVQ